MSKQRYVNTNFWIDDYINTLTPIEKFLFLYFMTNPCSELCGIYELPMRYIELETGLDKTTIMKCVNKFSKDRKIFYENGWVGVKNFIKHQKMNPNVKIGIARGLAIAPKSLLEKVQRAEKPKKRKPSKGFEDIPHLYLDLDSNLDLNKILVAEPPVPATFELKKEIDALEDHARRDLQIIGLYFKMKKPDIKTKAQFDVAIRRHVKAANALKVFDDEQILKGFRKASEFGEWTIETAIKHLTK